jgi:hypothetical protein
MPADKPPAEISQPKTGRRWPRRLRVCLAMMCLTLCFTSMAFWGQSYRHFGLASKVFFDTWFSLAGSGRGRVIIAVYSKEATAFMALRSPTVWRYKSNPTERDKMAFASGRGFLGFSLRSRQGFPVEILLPHWSLVLLFGSLAVLFRPPPRTLFGRREQLVAVALAAVSFGGVETLIHATPEFVFPHIPK